MKLTLTRNKELPTGTLGTLSIDGGFFCYTLERPTEASGGPAPFAIPKGTYRIAMLFSPHFQQPMPHLLNVPGRTEIEIHWGNYLKDIEGCILVGQNQSEGYVGKSRAAFAALMEKIKGQAELSIEIC